MAETHAQDELNAVALDAALDEYVAYGIDLGVAHPIAIRRALTKAIRAYLAASPPPEYLSGQEAVRVKPLEWRKEIGNVTGRPVWRAASIIGRYTVIGDLWWGPEPTNDWANDAGEEACMAAAQADYKNRILSAIATPDLKAGKAEVTAAPMSEGEKTAINIEFQRLYDEGMRLGKHGHYETAFAAMHKAYAPALAALRAPRKEQGAEPWTFCPECGSEEIRYEEGRHKQCANCGQEWFNDLDYRDVCATNLRRLYASPNGGREARDEWQVLAERAEQFAVSYANSNPRWTDNFKGATQDPCGVHRWLEDFRALRAHVEGKPE